MYAFSARCDQLEREATALDALLAAAGDDTGPATRIARRLRTEPFRVLVVGEFSRGKSTFINALAGELILPVAVRPTTAVISVLKPGPERRATLHWHDASRPPVPIALPVVDASKALSTVVTAQNTNATEIAKVVIDLPLDHLPLPVEIVDTPGVNDTCKQREDVTCDYLARADAAIVLLDVQQPLSGSEKEFLEERVMGSDIRKLLFVVNKVDQVDPSLREKALNYIRTQLSSLARLRQPEVIPVAAKQALRAKRDRDAIALDASLFPAFERRLLAFLAEGSGPGRVDTARTRVLRIADDLMHNLGETAKSLQGDAARVSAGLDDASRERDGVAAGVERLRADIELAVARYELEATQAIRTHATAARRRIAEVGGRNTFPSEADVKELRTLVNTAARDAAEAPRLAAQEAYQRLARDKPLRLAVDGGAELPAWESPDGEGEGLVAVGIGSAIGGFVGGLLLGPITGLPLAALGGWIGSLLGGGKPSGRELLAQLNEFVGTLEGGSLPAVRKGSEALRAQLAEALLAPREADLARLDRRLRELTAASREGAKEREARLAAVAGRLQQVRAITKRLAAEET